MFKCNFVGADGKRCGKSFESANSLRSHSAWHVGKLKNWKTAKEVRIINTKTAWNKHGKVLVGGFLRSFLSEHFPDLKELTEEIFLSVKERL